MRMRFLLTLACISTGWLVDCVYAEPVHKPGTIQVEKHSFKSAAGKKVEYEVGTLYVLENRSDPQSRVIGVGFARFPCEIQPAPAPPVFRLPGGPGGSGSSFLNRIAGKRGEHVEHYLPMVRHFRPFSDVVYVDQRGNSVRGDVLEGSLQRSLRPRDRALEIKDTIADYRAFAKQISAEYSQAGKPDLRGYTVKECAHDVDDLRRALGYEKIVLCGTSFGSQWSFAIMRLHPRIVARALLSGVEPLDHGYDMPSGVFAAMQRMWRSIEQDARFQPYLPEGGMAEAAEVVIKRLERGIKIYSEGDGDEGKRLLAVLGPIDFPWRYPTQIIELYHERMTRWQKYAAARTSKPTSRTVSLIFPLIDSSLGVTPEREYRLRTDPASRYLGRRFLIFANTADIWPSPDVGDKFRQPNFTETPVVFAQGDWDTNTPLENTLEIAPYFPNSRVLIARRGGHGVIEPIARRHPNTWAQLKQFVRTGDLKGIPTQVQMDPSRRFAPPFPLPKSKNSSPNPATMQ